jgi:adenylate cyclase
LYLFGVKNWPLFAFFYVSAFIMLVVTMKFGKPLGFIIPWDTEFRDFMSFQALVNTMIINGFGISYTLTSLSRAERDLARQVALSDALIDVMLPKSISSRLKSGEERQIADHVEAATVMFADLSGFTPAASKVSATELVTYLDDLFCKFDEFCEKRGVDKIKTIGDSYMAVGGLSGDGRAGAEAMGKLALDLIDCMAEQGPLGEITLRLRVGLHTGAVVAGVIGDVRVAYDVWSNTVNIAQRMEAFGEPDRIQVSSAFRDAAGEAFGYEPRGAMVIKGIGETETWFLRQSIKT